ncbi:GFA family protein [Donghicola mangrovi]|uniref:GFA family protein n=1 Tax=Donghicola mangrovi TaxID=2729614 RepID=A0A850QFE9_9RHOB|nr:GFA family protein [Donghicola mangrovi]NVO25105.1 GFA family protein [Donghicola mangrovi]
MATGSCLCGGVRYQVEGPMGPTFGCHCSQCRKTSGNFVTAFFAPRNGVTIHGEVRWYQSSATGRRGFCPTCGGQMFWDGGHPDLEIHAGSLDGDAPKLAYHIYCADKAGFYRITDGLPQFAAEAEDGDAQA